MKGWLGRRRVGKLILVYWGGMRVVANCECDCDVTKRYEQCCPCLVLPHSMAMDFSYSQTPNSVWWALEASHSLSTLNETDSPPTSPFRHRAGTALSDKMFYEFADEVDGDEDEKALIEWMKEYADRGVLR